MTKIQSPIVNLLDVLNVADYFLATSKKDDFQSDYLQFSILECLISLEDILDKGRGVVAFDGGSFLGEAKEEVNKKIDKLRGDIAEFIQKLVNQFGKEKVAAFFQERIGWAQTSWVHLIK